MLKNLIQQDRNVVNYPLKYVNLTFIGVYGVPFEHTPLTSRGHKERTPHLISDSTFLGLRVGSTIGRVEVSWT